MSAAYPEGECFFKRSALKTSTYDADKPEHFYAHMMVEYIRNKPAFHGSYESDYDKDRHFHLRSNYEVVKGDWWNTVYGNWTNISFLYGKKPYHDQYRHAVHDLCTNGNSFRDQEKGASLESWFMMIPMPMLATGEDWVLIDRLAYIRGLYIPIAHQASEDYPEACTFLQVNFATTREVQVLSYWEDRLDNWRVVNHDQTLNLDATLGLQPDVKQTMAINIRALLNLLSLPRCLRSSNAFSSRSILMVNRGLASTKEAPQKFTSSVDLSWTDVASANYGLAIQWKPAQANDWISQFIKNTVTTAVGFVPFIGPLAAVAFPLAWSAIADPDSFEDTLRGLHIAADLVIHIREEIERSAHEQRKFIPVEWVGKSGVVLFGIEMKDIPIKPNVEARPVVDEAKRKATLQKIESARKFQHWNLIKGPGQSAEKPKAQTAAVSSSQADQEWKAPLPEAPRKLSLNDMGPSTSFQFAGLVLENSGDNLALKTAEIGSEDDKIGEVLKKIVPDETIVSDDTPENDYNWMEVYLQGLMDGDAQSSQDIGQDIGDLHDTEGTQNDE